MAYYFHDILSNQNTPSFHKIYNFKAVRAFGRLAEKISQNVRNTLFFFVLAICSPFAFITNHGNFPFYYTQRKRGIVYLNIFFDPKTCLK